MHISIMKHFLVFLIIGLILIGFTPPAESQAGAAFSISVENSQIRIDVSPESNETTKCTGVVISNEGSDSIKVNVTTDMSQSLIDSGVVISLDNFSVNLSAGDSRVVDFCVTAQIGSISGQGFFNLYGSARNDDGDVVNKNAGFMIIIDFYANFSVIAEASNYEGCQSTNITTNITIMNAGNGMDTIAVNVDNQNDLESYGFVFSLTFAQVSIERNSTYIHNLPISLPEYNSSSNNTYYLKYWVGTTMQGVSASDFTTVTYTILECSEEKETSPLSSISLIISIILVGLIAIFRRK